LCRTVLELKKDERQRCEIEIRRSEKDGVSFTKADYGGAVRYKSMKKKGRFV
jgi:hypothetical protein